MIKQNEILSNIEIETKQPIQASIIWLHGLGADGSDFVPIVSELPFANTVGIRFIFPHAPIIPVTINNGYKMRAWYDISSLQEIAHDYPRIKQSVTEIKKLIVREIERGIPPHRIILAGFSQGAVIALAAGIPYIPPLAGIIALSGYLVLTEEELPSFTPLPIFLAHGIEDNVVPYVFGQRTQNMLCKANYPVEWRSYPISHGVCHEEIIDIGHWIKKILIM